MKKSQLWRRGAIAVRIALFTALLMLIIYFISLLSGFSPFFTVTAKNNAVIDVKTDVQKAELLFQKEYDKLYAIVDKVAFAEDKKQVDEVLTSYIGTDEFGDLRYFSNGTEYAPNGVKVEAENEEIQNLAVSKKQGCTSPYFDQSLSIDCIAFYVPVKGSEHVDGVMSIIGAREAFDLSSVRNERADFSCLMTETGAMLSVSKSEDFAIGHGNNFYDFIRVATESKEEYDEINKSIGRGMCASMEATLKGDEYVLAYHTLSAVDGTYYLISVSRFDALTQSEMTYIRQVIIVSVIAILCLMLSLLYTFLFHRRSTKEIREESMLDAAVGCGNAEQFKKEALEAFYDYRELRFIVLVAEVRQYKYLTDTFGEDETSKILRSLAKVIGTYCRDGEVFGYAGQGKFYILYKDAADEYLKSRIRILTVLGNKGEQLAGKGITLNFSVGGCRVDKNRSRSVSTLIENAEVACGFARRDVNHSFGVYTDEVDKEIQKESRIESQMEDALANGEFKLFLQPKYGIAKDEIDGAEALVRWFDPKKSAYAFPGEFIPLFESNGFISKLDHYMYVEVCKYIQQATLHGDPVKPISVNVSRVTATNDDFLDFYIENKKKYDIRNGLIVLEFTESFAMENYEKISTVVDKLHRNGILCSLDDFGAGYSSFSILKNIKMDEIKLDRFFIKQGFSEQRDKHLLKIVIELAKAFGMTVVQEGVETKEVFDLVKELGCDIVQGYYYAKPLPLEEYKIFIKTNTSIKYKSKVK